MAASNEELLDMLKILLNQPENAHNEVRNQLLQEMNNPDSPLFQAWKEVAGKSPHVTNNPQEFKEMLSSSLPMQNTPIPKPANYNSVLTHLDVQFAALRLKPSPTATQESRFAARIRQDMMLLMKKNPQAAGEFLSNKAVTDTDQAFPRAQALFRSLEEALKDDKTATSAMLLGLRANPKGATLLGSTATVLSGHLAGLPGEGPHKRGSQSEKKIEEKMNEKPSLQGILKDILKAVVSSIKEIEHVDTHKPMTPLSMKPKKP